MTDEIFDALSAAQRRRLLIGLLEHNPQDVSVLSGTPGAVPEGDEELIEAYHVHLPKLEDYGFVRWDSEEQVVTKGPRFDEIRPVVKLLHDHRNELPDGWL